MKVSAVGLSKRFPGVQALSDISVDFLPGEIHAICGENGAGKSTLGKVLAGLYSPEQGHVALDDRPVRFSSPREAQAAGISIVHQELLFAENLTVADNLLLGEIPNQFGWVSDRRMHETALRWLQKVGSDIDPSMEVSKLSVSKQQLVQIAGGIGRGAKVLIFDEPTSSLTATEATALLGLIRELSAAGTTCLYVSHRLDEIFAIADRVTVLRDGAWVGTKPIAEVTPSSLVQMMVGRELLPSSEGDGAFGEPVLEVRGLSSPGRFRDISLTVRAGEIVGLAGLVGAGRTEVCESIFGVDRRATGSVSVAGKSLVLGSPQRSISAGVALVPEDRKRHGLVLGMTIRHNGSIAVLPRLSTLGWLNRTAESRTVREFTDRLRVKAPSIESLVGGLSGGNQQKVVLAKWLATDAAVLLIDEPTRGVDVGAKVEIHGLIREAAASGKAVLLVSSDMPELRALCDRMIVLREGVQVAELGRAASETEILSAMAGV